MTRIIAAASLLAFGIAAASACPFGQTASKDVDTTVVASIDKTVPMSVPQNLPPAPSAKDKTADQDDTAK